MPLCIGELLQVISKVQVSIQTRQFWGPELPY